MEILTKNSDGKYMLKVVKCLEAVDIWLVKGEEYKVVEGYDYYDFGHTLVSKDVFEVVGDYDITYIYSMFLKYYNTEDELRDRRSWERAVRSNILHMGETVENKTIDYLRSINPRFNLKELERKKNALFSDEEVDKADTSMFKDLKKLDLFK